MDTSLKWERMLETEEEWRETSSTQKWSTLWLQAKLNRVVTKPWETYVCIFFRSFSPLLDFHPYLYKYATGMRGLQKMFALVHWHDFATLCVHTCKLGKCYRASVCFRSPPLFVVVYLFDIFKWDVEEQHRMWKILLKVTKVDAPFSVSSYGVCFSLPLAYSTKLSAYLEWVEL